MRKLWPVQGGTESDGMLHLYRPTVGVCLRVGGIYAGSRGILHGGGLRSRSKLVDSHPHVPQSQEQGYMCLVRWMEFSGAVNTDASFPLLNDPRNWVAK
jgi:hypothetical protein